MCLSCRRLKELHQDYLSKPLKQTQLIQCIVKYATMNGAMLEHKSKSRQKSVKYDPQTKAGGPEVTGQDQLRPPNARPGMGERGFTESPRGLESPRIVEEKSNPFEKVSLTIHSPEIVIDHEDADATESSQQLKTGVECI